MTTILLEPHLDDAVLFATYTLLREKPIVITVCSDAVVQDRYGIWGVTRRAEWKKSMDILGARWDYLGLRDDAIDTVTLGRLLRSRDEALQPSSVLVPMPEENGHEQHNQVAWAALNVFGSDRCGFYATYRRGSARSRTDTEVTPEPDWPAIKFRAMACYESQINLWNTRPWFAADDCLREWIA